MDPGNDRRSESNVSCCNRVYEVTAESVILELSNPQVEQEALNARLQLQSAQAQLENSEGPVQEDDLLTLESQTRRARRRSQAAATSTPTRRKRSPTRRLRVWSSIGGRRICVPSRSPDACHWNRRD